ncbi:MULTISPECIES: NAD-dependent epimerase/dehydratase family protein [unclassified Exiguobacterium]|uniref:NAD-dependent epimerase/dehydratase family protein n=1 Tax=unclassified Exiguobacterium TaxID=2644629 RepID=UPI0010401EB2|nr:MULTISPECIES: NAD-dependent epimerase/dehydratase family protein [unclassified Exiguobacterium]TCI71264.1 NAD-dependent epimerase/dehydratase family protein [Exiguobacterium sp. IPCI3]TCI81242.1 NAD-dependent epimerase/dehydratase family protein [Exiguobacterium sp. IPCH1]TCI82439.1 NAD-dependent epimerase/dehydratase family protein [Exiguobacterium sp. IPBC4]
MKKILLTGSNSYIGKSFVKWLESNHSSSVITVESLSVRNNEWLEKKFIKYDTIVHLAAIVHNPTASKELYYQVNRDLAFQIAKKAKNDGVKQFIFFSTLSVYGLSQGIINKNTPLNPKNDYGKSKLQAEEEILALEDDTFKVVIVRPPIVYGPGSPGNFRKMLMFFEYLPVFLDIPNKRSMIYIDNLSYFLYLLIDNEERGIYIPQNAEYSSTYQIFLKYREKRKCFSLRIPHSFVDIIKKSSIGSKIFGDLVVNSNVCHYKLPYQIVSFNESITSFRKV